jgi:hypothetical protein
MNAANRRRIVADLTIQFQQLADIDPNLSAEEQIRRKNIVLKALFEYLSSVPKYLATTPRFRRETQAKAEELLNDAMASEELKAAAGELLNMISTLPEDPHYMERGARRRRKRTRKAERRTGSRKRRA